MVKFAKRTHWNTEGNELAKALAGLEAQGKSIFDLTLSNPTKCGFKYLNQSILEPLRDSCVLAYEPEALGPSAARQVLSHYYASKDVDITPNQLVLTASTSEAYAHIFRLLTNPGDKILVPQPGYPLLQQLAELHDLEILPYEVHFESGTWKIKKEFFPAPTGIASSPSTSSGSSQRQDAHCLCEARRAEAISNALTTPLSSQRHGGKACLVFVMNPSNPCGNFCSPDEFAFIEDYCQEHDLALVCDEVFHDYPLDQKGPALSAAILSKVLTFTVSGISKVLGLPGMKIGWTCITGPENEVSEALSRLEIINDAFLSVATPQLQALQKWFNMRPQIQDEIKARLTANYTRLKQELKKTEKLELYSIQGGWHAVLQLPDDLDDLNFALQLLEKHSVLTHPGYLFDFNDSNKLVISLLCSESDFHEGVARLIYAISA